MNHFWNGVRMRLGETSRQLFHTSGYRLRDEKYLIVFVKFALPPIDRSNPRNDIDTSRQGTLHEQARKSTGDLQIRCGR